VIAGAFNTARLEMTKIFGVPVSLTIGTLRDVTRVFGWFKADFTALQEFHLIYGLIVGGREQVNEEH
jgi:hypothetical protein